MKSAFYLPSFFRISIPTQDPLDNIFLLSNTNQGLYYHEYIHYLQDLTTTFGIIKIWQSYDRIKELIVDVRNSKGAISIPVTSPKADELKEYWRFLLRMEGDFRVRDIQPVIAEKLQINQVKLTPDPLINKIIPGLRARHVDLALNHQNIHANYRFGQNAICETMAYLAESKLYKLNSPERYPYLVARELAAMVHLPIAQNNELLFSLCDVTLMHPLPGWMFYRLLVRMCKQNFVPTQGEDVYNYAYNFYLNEGWDIVGQCHKAEYSIEHILNQLFGHPFYSNSLLWLQWIIKKGQSLRWARPFFFLELYRESKPFNHLFTSIWESLGGPLCVNQNGLSYMTPPLNLRHLADQIHPQHFLVSRQLNELLLKGSYQCDLESICTKMKNPIPVDYRCRSMPWDRSHDQQICPFGAAWGLYELDKVDFTIKGVQIQ